MRAPEVAFFDCDYTVIATDSELAWKNMLADIGRVPDDHRALQQHYIDLHAIGQLPVDDYVEFQLREFVGQTAEAMKALAEYNFEHYLRDRILEGAVQEINEHRDRSTRLVLLSGAIRAIITPVAEALGFDDIACTELELVDAKFTGNIVGPFCVGEGKLERCITYCDEHGIEIGNSTYYGDSISDVQLFEKIGAPVVVNPAEELAVLARNRGWTIVSW